MDMAEPFAPMGLFSHLVLNSKSNFNVLYCNSLLRTVTVAGQISLQSSRNLLTNRDLNNSTKSTSTTRLSQLFEIMTARAVII